MSTNTMGRPRGDMPFCETLQDGRIVFRQKVPADLSPVVGDYWVHRFPAGTSEDTMKVVAQALAARHDVIIEEMRGRIAAIRGVRSSRRKS